MNLSDIHAFTEPLKKTPRMPILFVGHGSPTNALEENEFVKGWHKIATSIPTPQAIVCVSAHWLTRGTQVTAMQMPKTIHDFGGFQKEMYEMQYKAKGDPDLATDIKNHLTHTSVLLDDKWGLDHGTWVPLMKMYPNANIPVIQLSIDYTQPAQYHYNLAKELNYLRDKGVLIIGSGNMVHNLGMIQLPNGFSDINTEFGFDWALEMNTIFKNKIISRDHQALIHYESLNKAAKLAIPSIDHYFPLLYILAMQHKEENAVFFNDKAIAGSLTMTSVLIS